MARPISDRPPPRLLRAPWKMSIAPKPPRPTRVLTVAAVVAGLLFVSMPAALSVESGSPVSPAPADAPRPPADIPAATAPTTAAPPPAAAAPAAPAPRSTETAPPPAAAAPAAHRKAPAATTTAAPAQGSINDDTARYLAGMEPAPGSPIAALTRDD